MSLFNSIVKNLNPVKLVSSIVGGTVGKVIGIASNIVTGIAQGKSFGEIMKGVVKDVAALAITAAITYFTGGTAGLFINTVLDKAKGIIGDVAAKVATSALAKPVSGWITHQLTGFANTLTTDFVRKQLTDVVLNATGLKDEHEKLEQAHLDALSRGDWFAQFLDAQFNNSVSATARAATLGSIQNSVGRPVDTFGA